MSHAIPGVAGNLVLKGKNLPAQIVYQSTGMQCAYFSRNASVKNIAAGRRKKKSGILDIDG